VTKKILFLTANRLGDAVLSSGLLAHLVHAYPDAELTVACGPVAAPLFRAVPRLRRVIPLEKQPHYGHWRQFWRACVGTRWDMIVDLRRSFAAQLLWGRRFALPAEAAGEHKVLHYARTLGLSPAPAPQVFLDDTAREAAKAALPDGQKYFAVGATANWRGKIWPQEKFAAAVTALTAPGGTLHGHVPVFFGAPGEAPQVEKLLQSVPNICLIGKVDVLATAAAFARCEIYMGNDSGLMHLAAAMGLPTLGLFGPSHPEIYGPYGTHTAWVRTAKSYDALVHVPGYDHRTTGTLMDSLAVDTVVDAVHQLWQRKQQAIA
jgi:ADP-heptose:LPS heptosyltransferase